MIFVFDKFGSYLIGSKIVVYTNHSTLKYLLVKKDAKPRLMRWILLEEFKEEIRGKKLSKNLVVEHLSKLEISSEEQGEINEKFFSQLLLLLLF